MRKSSNQKLYLGNRPRKIDMTCKFCNRIVRNVGHDTVAVTCRWCVLSKTENEIAKNSSKNTFVRGWHLKKEFISEDGRIFHRGIEQKRNSDD